MTPTRPESSWQVCRTRRVRWLYSIALGLVATAMFPATVGAIPAYARRYNVNCTTCHAPLPPRLNNVGILFRKLGFRMPDADDQGRLIIKPIPAHNIGEAASLFANVDARRDKESEPGTSRTTFELDEVNLIAGTAVGNHLSGQVLVPWSDGQINVEDAEVQFNGGTPRHQWLTRGGLLQTAIWQKATQGTLTLSAPLLFDSQAVAGVGPFAGFGLGTNQIGAEAGYMFSGLHEGRLSSTMMTVSLLNGVNQQGEDALRNTTGGIDVYVQGLQLLGSRHTIGGFYYHGRSFLDTSPDQGLLAPDKQRFSRYGVTGNYLLMKRFDIVGAAAWGSDQSPVFPQDVRFSGFFTELDAQITRYWIGVYRFDRVDPNRDVEDDEARAHTFSTTVRADDHLYLTGEYEWQRLVTAEKPWTVIVSARFIY